MAARTSAHPNSGDELEIEILDPAIGGAPSAAPGERATVEAEAAETPLTVWIDDLRETVDDVLAPAKRATETTSLVTGSWLHRWGVRRKQRIADRNPRRQSRIRVHVFIPFAVACSRLPAEGASVSARGTVLRLEGPFDDFRAGLRAPAALHLRGSWPELPVWIDVEPWWRRQTIVTLSLRSTKRVRYPRRYFASGHRTLRRLVATLART